MNFQTIVPDKSIALFVKTIWVFENIDSDIKTNLPFFADGYPGLLFQQTANGLIVNPHKKQMPVLFLYGQTLHPIEMEIDGTYQLIIYQLYPFVLKSFFGVTPRSINDNCYDLAQLKEFDTPTFTKQLLACSELSQRIEALTSFLYQMFQLKKQSLDLTIRQVIEKIVLTKGQEPIRAIAEELELNPRTLERRFVSETGLLPKQFAQIIQFQLSLEQLTIKDYNKLTDIVYENGFADQSHFIRVFKAYTGKTPKVFSKK
ncbi:helix-turn-helix domain-containing protein [Xanthocytophaga agilis]|uniref:Helix-turn-helix domain-containing protein n=1 Tax=Xanthocytophaga agilis TaxID=3048010 RepID=A0AAE3UGA6_9BACT|nr:helix-turn-helix domain-containing protein [Xanthocytophaga agilis]MDJ1504718.1 helix-turn-helix domain-containing protein [Xanthocytophaga agilis]